MATFLDTAEGLVLLDVHGSVLNPGVLVEVVEGPEPDMTGARKVPIQIPDDKENAWNPLRFVPNRGLRHKDIYSDCFGCPFSGKCDSAAIRCP